MQIHGRIFAMQLSSNQISAWVISSKFAAFLQSTYFEKPTCKATSEYLHHNKKQAAYGFLSLSPVIIHQFCSYTKILTLTTFIPTTSSPRSQPDCPHSHHLHPDSPDSHPDSPQFHHSLILFPIPIPAFTDSP